MSPLHPENKDFNWVDRPLDGLQLLSARHVEQFNEQGYCVLNGAVSTSELTMLLAEIDPIEQAGGGSTLVGEGGELASYQADELTFTCNLSVRSKKLAAFYGSRLFRGITHDLIGERCRLYWDQAVYKHPQKGGEFPWHQDNGYTFVEPQAYLTCWLALKDAPIAAGCPWVIPKAHRAGTYSHQKQFYGLEIEGVDDLREAYGEVAAPVKAGDMVIFSSLTPHKTGPNLLDYIRKALIVQFIPDGAVRLESDQKIPLTDPIQNQLLG